MTFNEENAVHEITENTKQQTSETKLQPIW
jgi:hypothetical protein